ncbi:ead/Ea22-like family protein [Citrobacter amalonaticus]
MSNIDKQALRKRYSAKPTPKCDICGARMTIQRMSGSRVTYGCSGAIYDETGCHYAEGQSLADDHYEQSRVTVTDESDPDVLALLDELEAAENRIAEVESQRRMAFMACNRWADKFREAEKRVAELEAMQGKPVMFIDGDISSADADKLAAVIREFKEETETPAARMARIIRENPHPTNMCDMPSAGTGKGE